MDLNHPYEKLGLFYLGKEAHVGDKPDTDMPFLYKSKHLTTHGVIIGMTGSGKTGLGIGLIEEAVMDNIPSIIIDPKGDMVNLLLGFPELKSADFEPWIDPAEASRKNMSVADLAEQTARNWREGLASWGQGGERIAALRDKTVMTVYTPGSNSGIPVSILSGFHAPAPDILSDQDGLNALVGSTATSLLSLVNIQGDPLTSKEHILISSILLHHWRKGEDLSIESLIGAIVNPPFDKMGAFGLSSVFPQPERMNLAMLINNLIAAPFFGSWLQGEALDIQRILYGDDGKPRTSIFFISHLSEPERMFFVTLLLNAVIGWMRVQRGTSSLKALLYMDEIFGYFPSNGNPPSKKPMLLLLKQARAFGVGVVLATQNPVDLDYKGLSNIGSWFVGRLQTTQDQNRVLDGIVGASHGLLDRAAVRNMLADMKPRRFLLSSAHYDEPLLFETRWAMSYLKGPMSLQDIGSLMQGRRDAAADLGTPAVDPVERTGDLGEGPPLLSEGVAQRFYLPPVLAEQVVFEPWLAACASVRFRDSRRNIDERRDYRFRIYLDETSDDLQWSDAEPLTINLDECTDAPPDGSSFYGLPGAFSSLKSLQTYEKDFSNHLYQTQRLELLRAPSLKLESRPGESEADFAVRIRDGLREQKEAAAEKLLAGFKTRRDRLQKKLDTALARIEKEKSDVSVRTTDTLISFGTAVLGAFLGRKALSSTTVNRTAGGIRKAGRIAKEKDDVRRAEEAVRLIEGEMAQLEDEQARAVNELAERFDESRVEREGFTIRPRRGDIYNVRVCLLWEMIPPAPL